MLAALKVLEVFILPTIFTFVFLVAGFGLRIRWAMGLGLIFLYLFSITPVSKGLLLPLERPYQPATVQKPCVSDTAVLLLGGFEEDVTRAAGVLELSTACGAPFHVIISGTDPLLKESPEAREVRDLLISEGLRPRAILLEERSRTTLESAKNLAESLGRKPFYLVTSAYHMTRSLYAFHQFGMNPVPLAGPYRMPRCCTLFDFIPSSTNLLKSDEAFHEYAGLLFYRKMGTHH